MPHNKSIVKYMTAVAALLACLPLTAVAQPIESSEFSLSHSDFSAYEPTFTPWFSVTGQLLWLHRTEADRNQSLVIASTATTTTTVISMDNLNLPTEAGFRGSVLLGPPAGRQIELAYSGIFDQDAQASVNIDPASTGVVQMTQQFFGATMTSLTNFQYTSTYESDLHSPELNLWLDDDYWRFRPLLGVRWIQQDERFRVFETQTPGNGGVAEFSNELLGGQLGFQSVLWQRSDWFHVLATCKAGMYRNNMEMTSTLNAGGVPVATLVRQFNTTSYSGAVELSAVWQLTRHLNFHVGYSGLWLTEVGLVGDQNDNFDVLAGTGTLDLGGVSYQGGHLGVTISW